MLERFIGWSAVEREGASVQGRSWRRLKLVRMCEGEVKILYYRGEAEMDTFTGTNALLLSVEFAVVSFSFS